MCQTSLSLAQSPRPSVPYYWRSLLIGGRYRYLHRRALNSLIFFSSICFAVSELKSPKILNRYTPIDSINTPTRTVAAISNALLAFSTFSPP